MNTTESEGPSRELDSQRIRALVESLIHLTPASRHLIEVMKGVPQFDGPQADDARLNLPRPAR